MPYTEVYLGGKIEVFCAFSYRVFAEILVSWFRHCVGSLFWRFGWNVLPQSSRWLSVVQVDASILLRKRLISVAFSKGRVYSVVIWFSKLAEIGHSIKVFFFSQQLLLLLLLIIIIIILILLLLLLLLLLPPVLLLPLFKHTSRAIEKCK
jgi:hypothetical protein